MNYWVKVLLKILLALGLGLFLTIWVYPTPGERYEGVFWGFWTGCWHGGLMVPNWIWSFFDETRLIKASSSSAWYDLCWWVAAVSSFLGHFVRPFNPTSDDY